MKICACMHSAFGFALMVLFAAPAHAEDARPSVVQLAEQWDAWHDDLRGMMDVCLGGNGSSCLEKAFRELPRPPIDNPQHTVSGELLYDLRTADAMLSIPSVADALWREYGVDTVAYLGTGYSVPLTPAGVAPYWQGMQREYFVPNLCAQTIDPAICPKADPDVWTWRLTSAEMKAALDKPIGALLKGNTQTLKRRIGAAPRNDGLPNALVRFALLDPANYKGTFGRADAKRVFFADFTQVSGKSLRAALVATGASTLIANPNPNQAFFMWVYAPGKNTNAAAASWRAVFESLEAD
jgi:hypothetical protein